MKAYTIGQKFNPSQVFYRIKPTDIFEIIGQLNAVVYTGKRISDGYIEHFHKCYINLIDEDGPNNLPDWF